MNTPHPADRDSHAAPTKFPPAGPGLPAGPAAVRVAVLGPLAIRGTAGCLQPGQAELVVALALAGPAGLSNGVLRSMLGEDPDHPYAGHSLRQCITRTRRRLGGAPGGGEYIIHAGNAQYVLDPAASLDWDEFRALSRAGRAGRDRQPLRAALELLRGDPFQGLYYWWLDSSPIQSLRAPSLIEAVRSEIVDTAALLAGLELDAGDPAAAGRAARAGLAADMSAEQLWRALMRAEDAAGNTAGVHKAWRRCLAAVAEIAADGQPHPDTFGLYRQLTEQASFAAARRQAVAAGGSAGRARRGLAS